MGCKKVTLLVLVTTVVVNVDCLCLSTSVVAPRFTSAPRASHIVQGSDLQRCNKGCLQRDRDKL